jgi:hypothetical protein
MTDEELDTARAKEAVRKVYGAATHTTVAEQVAFIAAKLARERWTPAEPNLVLARQVVIDYSAEHSIPLAVDETRAGRCDTDPWVQIAFAGIKAARGEGA